MPKPDPWKGYYLRPTQRTTAPTKLLVVHCAERQRRDSDNPRRTYCTLRCGVVQYVQVDKRTLPTVQEYRFASPAEFWDLVQSHTSSRYTTYIYSHGMGYQLQLLDIVLAVNAGWLSIDRGRETVLSWGGERECNPSLESVRQCWDDGPLLLSGRTEHGRVAIRDLQNYWPTSLERLAELVGVEIPAPMDEVYSDRQWEEWCSACCTVGREALLEIIQWWRSEGYGTFGKTMAGMARSAYTTGFMRARPWIQHHATADHLAREAFYGGRTECFRLGQIPGPVYKVDMRSAYASVMADRMYPSKIRGIVYDPDVSVLKQALYRYGCIADVEISTASPCYPKRINKCLCYPVGTYRTVLAGEDLERAVESGAIRYCRTLATWQMDDLFTDYVRHMSHARDEAREAGNCLLEATIKHMMVCFFGGWGARTSGWETLPGPSQIGPSGQCWIGSEKPGSGYLARSLGGYWQRRVSRGPSAASLCAISAYVTAYQRAEMDRLRAVAGEECVYIQVIDCLYVSQTGYDRLLEAGEMEPRMVGGLRLDATLSELTVHGLNDIERDQEAYVAGVTSRAIPDRPGVFEQRKRHGLAWALDHGQYGVAVVDDQVVTKRRVYPKGNHDEEGFWYPLSIHECDSKEAF